MAQDGIERTIEECALNAWPALEQRWYDGWLLRVAQGYTKRANSVNPLDRGQLDAGEKIEYCETLYREQGLRSIFRLTPWAWPADLDDRLSRRGYQVLDPTLVWQRPLPSSQLDLTASDQGAELREMELDPWLQFHARLSGEPLGLLSLHKALLARIQLPCYLGMLWNGGQAVAAGMAVREGKMMGIFDVVTGWAYRRRGYGRQVMAGLLCWGEERGARTAYLQVVERNTPARALYASFGFESAYRYWYRVAQT
jgi:GNAT superfamily N-acetyltransferase